MLSVVLVSVVLVFVVLVSVVLVYVVLVSVVLVSVVLVSVSMSVCSWHLGDQQPRHARHCAGPAAPSVGPHTRTHDRLAESRS